jgi:aminoglycoside 6-adenylyltransferase
VAEVHTGAVPTEIASHDELLTDRIVPWAQATDDVRGLVVVGSRVRTDRPADEWSDLDMVILSTERERYAGTAWLDEIAPHWLELTHPGPLPGFPVRQVMFAGALDCDIIPMAAGGLQSVLDSEPAVALVLGDGWRAIVDKDGELGSLRVPMSSAPASGIVTESDYLWAISDFLYQAVWTTKHLRRGELWLPKDDVDSYMKGRLLSMIEWHARARGRDVTTWGETSGGRLLELWADPRVLEALGTAFARYDPADVARALLETMRLFRWVAEEVAAETGYRYPAETHDTIEAWVRGSLTDGNLPT